MEGNILTKVVLPAALFFVMLGMGLSLTLADFRRVFKYPKAVGVGIACQMLLLPIVGFAIAKGLGMAPVLAVGLVVISLAPGGTTSNMISFLSRGDLALSITLTAIVSMVTPFTIPLVAGLAMDHFMGADQAITVPIGMTIAQLVVITIVPVLIGMGINKKAPRFAEAADKPVKVISLVVLFLIIGLLINDSWADLPTFFAQAGTGALILNVVTMAAGFGIALAAKLSRKQAITVGVEVGIQNGTLALAVTSTILKNPTMSIPPAIYSLIMFATGAAFGVLVNLGRKPEAEVEPGAEPEAKTAEP